VENALFSAMAAIGRASAILIDEMTFNILANDEAPI
jgi:hypothetical protein